MKNEEVTTAFVCEELIQLLKIRLVEFDIGDSYPLRKTENCPVKIELISDMKKKLIIKNTKNSKETGVFIANDLTLQKQEETLNQFLKNARQEALIRGNKLEIGRNIFTSEDLKTLESRSNQVVHSIHL